VDIRKQSALDEVEETELEPIERAMKVLNLIERFRLTEADISLSADTDCNEQRAAAPAGRKIMSVMSTTVRGS
jgi:hypothetical protein